LEGTHGLKNHGVVHISFTRPPSVIRALKGMAAFAIGLKLLVPTSGRHGLRAVKDSKE
jgi:hypothetical protein